MSSTPTAPLPVVGVDIGPLWASKLNTAILELQSIVTTLVTLGLRNVKLFGAIGNGLADDTAAVQAAITATAGQGLWFPAGTYKITSTLFITGRGHRLVGDYGIRGNLGGSELKFYGTGSLFQIGSDNGHSFDANDYDGPQDQTFEHLWLSHAAPDTPLTCDATQLYKLGSYGIRDFRAGGLQVRDVGIEHFEYNFWGVQSDVNVFETITSLYSKNGLYIGPRSDQNTIHRLYSFICDRAIVLDRPNQTRIVDAQLVGVGNATDCAIDIRQGTAGVVIVRPWFENLGVVGYLGTDLAGCVAAGMTAGYNSTTTAAKEISVQDPLCYTVLAANPGHAKCVVQLGKALDVRLSRPTAPVSSAITNYDALVIAPAGTAFTNAEAQVKVDAVGFATTQAKLFVNSGTGAPDVALYADGPGGQRFVNSNGRLQIEVLGGAAGTEFYLSSEGVAGAIQAISPTYAFGQTVRIQLKRVVMNGTAAPVAGTWQAGDMVISFGTPSTPSAGWVCTADGTPGTWVEFGRRCALPSAVVKNANYNVTTFDTMLVASGGAGAIVFTMPAAPFNGQLLTVGNHNGANTLTMGRNGNNIDGVAADLVIAAAGRMSLYFVTGSGWFTIG